MIRQGLFVAGAGFLVVATSYGVGRLTAVSEPAPARWQDEIVALEVRVQEDLTVVVTVTNRSHSTQLVPAVVTRVNLLDVSGTALPRDAPFADWEPESDPVLELAPGKSYSESTDLVRLFPSLAPGDYSVRFRYFAVPGSGTTWHGSAVMPIISLRVRRLAG
jgi:hypothetical protein